MEWTLSTNTEVWYSCAVNPHSVYLGAAHKNMLSVTRVQYTKVLTPYKLCCTLPYDFPFPGCKIKVERSRETGFRETGRSRGTLLYSSISNASNLTGQTYFRF